MYADDKVIYFSANCCQNIEYHLNTDLANLAEWFNNNYLTLHTSKSKFVMFGGDRPPPPPPPGIEGCKPAKELSLSLITQTMRAKIQSSI